MIVAAGLGLRRRGRAVGLLVLATTSSRAPAAPGSLSVQMTLPVAPSPPACGPDPWIHLAEAAVWPVAAIILALWLRAPLVRFAEGLAGRISKLSVFSVAIELAAAQPAGSKTPLLEELRNPRQVYVGDSAPALITQLQSLEPADYSAIYLGKGDEWLTSRLYLAAVMLERMRGINLTESRKRLAWGFAGRRVVIGC